MAGLSTLVSLRWSDMDALGHVHNAKFLEYFEMGRVDLARRLRQAAPDSGISLVVARHEVDYRQRLVYRPEPVLVHTLVERIGTSSITLRARLSDPAGDTVYAQIVTVIVAVDNTTGQPVAIPDQMRTLLVQLS